MAQAEEGPEELALDLIPLKDLVVFPHLILPLMIQRERSIRSLEQALQGEREILVVAQRNPDQEDPTRRDLYPVGTRCTILQSLKMPDGGHRIVVQGTARARILKALPRSAGLRARVRTLVPEGPADPGELRTPMQIVMNQFRQAVDLGKPLPQELLIALLNIEDPGHLADVATFHLDLKLAEKQALLGDVQVARRLKKVTLHLSREIEVLKLEQQIQARAEREMERGQRDFFLRHQLKAIQAELGGAPEDQDEATELAQAVAAAGMPAPVQEHALKELRRLERIPPASAERTVLRTYLDWLLQVPWSATSEDRLDLTEARAILEADHHGLQDVKERILEFLAVRKLAGAHKGPILCLVGPPGVGKTSLGRSIARALGRAFQRASLGGIRDEAEIRGHRRTYVGALPGRIVQALCAAKSRDPVLVLDEIDKVGADYRGDPAAALLELLDPEQNHEFKDHYLSVPVDLSGVMFILTANLLEPIPAPLRDRLEVIRLPGYTEEEKLHIATSFLVPRQREEHGLSEPQLRIAPGALRRLIREYTREAGVRGLTREIARLCRKRAREIVEGAGSSRRRPPVQAQALPRLLGAPPFRWGPEEPFEQAPGAARGLSWTQVGGDVLTVEASLMPGKGKMLLTGSLGAVMKESARTAVSWVRGHLQAEARPFDFYGQDVHLHVPEGAIPKDGPSAGITMASAFYSALTGAPVRWDLAMTGEISLRGRVMPVGGIKEKILAAFNQGIREVILPADNSRDLDEIPGPVRNQMTFHLVQQMPQVLSLALSPIPTPEVSSRGTDPNTEPPCSSACSP